MLTTIVYRAEPPQEAGYYPMRRMSATKEWQTFPNVDSAPVRFYEHDEAVEWLKAYEREVERVRTKARALLVGARDMLYELRGYEENEVSSYMHAITTVDALLIALYERSL